MRINLTISNYDFALVRYNADGSLDTSFGTGGKVTTDFGSSFDQGTAVAIDASGKIVVAGRAGTAFISDFAVARYNADGSLDTSFDTDGKVTTDFGSNSDLGQAVAIDASGKIVVAGLTYTGIGSGIDFALARYNADGSLDTSFDGDGKVTTDIAGNDVGRAVAIDASGRIVVAGYAGYNPTFVFAVARYGNFAPTAASVSISGRVFSSANGKSGRSATSTGRGIGKVYVTLTNQNGETVTAMTNPFGYFTFTEVASGETYIISARHKIYQFVPSSQVINVVENLTDVQFTGYRTLRYP